MEEKIRELLGYTIFEFDQRYGLQTIKDNINLFSPEVLDKINQVVVKAGHNMVRENDDIPLKGRWIRLLSRPIFPFPQISTCYWMLFARLCLYLAVYKVIDKRVMKMESLL